MTGPRLAAALAALLAGPAAAGEWQAYMLHCSGCHRADGAGLPERGIPDLREAARHAADPAWRDYLVQVPGVAQSRLSDAELAALLNWVLLRFGEGAPAAFQPFTGSAVARLRRAAASDAGTRREALLRELTPR